MAPDGVGEVRHGVSPVGHVVTKSLRIPGAPTATTIHTPQPQTRTHAAHRHPHLHLEDREADAKVNGHTHPVRPRRLPWEANES